MTYIELPSDADFDGFLSTLTPSVARKDLTSGFSKEEKKRERFLSTKRKATAKDELAEERTNRAAIRSEQTAIAMRMAGEMKLGEIA